MRGFVVDGTNLQVFYKPLQKSDEMLCFPYIAGYGFVQQIVGEHWKNVRYDFRHMKPRTRCSHESIRVALVCDGFL